MNRTNIRNSFLAAVVVGFINVSFIVSFSALVFQGGLFRYFALGVSVILFSYAVAGAIMAAGSSLPGLIVRPKGVLIAIVSLMSLNLSRATAWASPETALYSLLTCMAVSTFACGLAFWLLGRFKLGNLIRFIPFPIIAGYSGSAGLLLINGAFSIMTGESLSISGLTGLFAGEKLLQWAPGAAFAALGLWLGRKMTRNLIIPVMIAAGVVLFFVVAVVMSLPFDQLREAGILMQPLNDAPELPKLFSEFLAGADASLVLGQWGGILSIVFVACLAILLAISGVEVGTQREIDLEKDLKAAGIANMVIALFGGPVVYHESYETRLARGLGGDNRLTGVMIAGLCVMFAAFGYRFVGYLPKPIMGGLILFIGAGLFAGNVSRTWQTASRAEGGLVALIMASVLFWGLPQGIGIGILGAMVLFVLNYSRIEIVRSRLTGEIYRSKVERSPKEERVLREKGSRLRAFILQGYIFFGTSEKLVTKVREDIRLMKRDPRFDRGFVLIDFRMAPSIDSAAVNTFEKLARILEEAGIFLVMTSLNPRLESYFRTVDMFAKPNVIRLKDFDHGLEWCEDRLLETDVLAEEDAFHLEASLNEILQDPALIPKFVTFLTETHFKKNEKLFTQGDPAACLFVIKSGRVAILLERADGETLRLRTFGPGSVFGEIGLYTNSARSASAVAIHDLTVYALDYNSFQAMEKENPDIARAFHKWVVQTMAHRMAQDDEALRNLLI